VAIASRISLPRAGLGNDRFTAASHAMLAATKPPRRPGQATPKLIRLRTGAPDFSIAKPSLI
jgi:hypothetical protein